MQTKEKAWFGQRLWTDIIVTDDETDWHVVGLNSQSSSPVAPVAIVPQSTTSSLPAPVAPVTVVEVPHPAPAPVPVPVPVPPVTVTVPVTAKSVPLPVLECVSAAPLFARELRVLADMGFTDLSVVMPLLQEHVENAENPTLGLQRVVAALFSDEGIWN